MNEPLRLCILGASTDTGNLGVSALCLSMLRGLARREPDAKVTVFDERRGDGDEVERLDGVPFAFRRCGLHHSRRFYRRDSFWNVRVSSRFGGAGNAAAIAFREADAVLDITGGDSFTDLYGPKRFEAGCAGKRLALEHSGGLVLMPQTYGPYSAERSRTEAARLVAGASMAWARDEASFEVLRGLLGDRFDPARHRSGVDVAFRLGVEEPHRELDPVLRDWISERRSRPTVGLNVSGLTYVRAEKARRDYGLAADYRAIVHGILARLMSGTDANVVLVPHVLAPPGNFESDIEACRSSLASLGGRFAGRVLVAPELNASEAKWLISRMDWFCGTRMHSTIAALSSGVPCSALAYSLKTHGVFETCGQGAHVAELRTLEAPEAIETVWRSWEARHDAKLSLAASLPRVLERADAQMDEVMAMCRTLASRRRRGSGHSLA